jgi:acyl-CoA thioesterase FadM
VTSRLVGRSSRALFWQQSVGPPGAGAKPHLTCEAVTYCADAHSAPFDALPLLADDLLLELPPLSPDAQYIVTTTVELSADELNGGSNTPSEADVLRWFERNRTDVIGGGSGLAELQAAGCLVVVTALDEFRLDSGAEWGCGTVTVRSQITVKRKGMLVRFDQMVLGKNGAVLARGRVTCACVDARSMSLMEAPPALLARLTASV